MVIKKIQGFFRNLTSFESALIVTASLHSFSDGVQTLKAGIDSVFDLLIFELNVLLTAQLYFFQVVLVRLVSL